MGWQNLWMKMRIDGSADHVEKQAKGNALAGKYSGELLAIASSPGRGIEPEQPFHALASLCWPVWATAIIDFSRARRARSPSAVRR